MTESVVMMEYNQMVADSTQRQKIYEKEANNNIRGNYMDRLGVGNRDRDSPSEPSTNSTTNRVSNVSMDTYALESRKSSNLQVQRDMSSPKEI